MAANYYGAGMLKGHSKYNSWSTLLPKQGIRKESPTWWRYIGECGDNFVISGKLYEGMGLI